jgi:hypothetical protein
MTPGILFGCLFGIYALIAGWFVGFATRDGRQKRRRYPSRTNVSPRPLLGHADGRSGHDQDYSAVKCPHPSMRSTGEFLATGRIRPTMLTCARAFANQCHRPMRR